MPRIVSKFFLHIRISIWSRVHCWSSFFKVQNHLWMKSSINNFLTHYLLWIKSMTFFTFPPFVLRIGIVVDFTEIAKHYLNCYTINNRFKNLNIYRVEFMTWSKSKRCTTKWQSISFDWFYWYWLLPLDFAPN